MLGNDDDYAVVPQGHPATSRAVALYWAQQRREWDDPAGLDFGCLLPATAHVEIYDPQPRRLPGSRPLHRLLPQRRSTKPQR
jgi:hypothetical protein